MLRRPAPPSRRHPLTVTRRRPSARTLASMASQRQIDVGGVPIGGGAPVAVQTMTKTETANLQATMDQIRTVADAGADIVRVRGSARQGRRGAQDDRQGVADPRDRGHPLQPHARAEGDRRRRPLHAPEPGQHRRPREGRRGGRAGDQARHADAHRRQLRVAAQAPARARAREPGRGAGGRRGRVRGADGAPALRGLQGLDQVDQRAEHDRLQPAALRADPVPAAPRHHRGGDEVVGLAEVRGRPRHAAGRRHRRHDPHLALDVPRRGGGQGRLGDPQGAASCASAARC